MKSAFLKRLALAAALSLAAVSAFAAPVTYKLNANHTVVLATWSHFGFSHPSANFGQADGTLVYDAAKVGNSSVEVTLPLAGINSFVPKLDTDLKSAEIFDAEKFPIITFKSTKVETAGKDRLKVSGNLTIKGVARLVVLDVSLNKAGPHPMGKPETIGFDANTTIKRSEFGVDKLLPGIADEVQIHISTEATATAE